MSDTRIFMGSHVDHKWATYGTVGRSFMSDTRIFMVSHVDHKWATYGWVLYNWAAYN